ncbi:TPA: AAA family ATPase [Aeromonas hydrophila]|uniref:ATP-dependent nuclease n=1 Tax=Aeromonas hydrophila TaxID=644 RepID=UPI0021E90981|nr:AAA family ATPase [Aeromonas hydrophila]MCV3294078.1 AAA family ATPase [Aeromonas hydrophila]
MHIERINLQNFRSFGPKCQSIAVDPDLTTLVGANGSGKTALMQALQRMFGISNEQRSIRRQDFHIPSLEKEIPSKRTLTLEAIVAFPELDDEDGDHSVIPDFFHHMSVTDEGGKLKCRLRLDAEWEDDGSIDGYITSQFRVVTTWGEPEEADFQNLRPADRSRIQLIYVPATRCAVSQVSAFLKSRLWKAINWSEQVRSSFTQKAEDLNESFEGENAISTITGKLTERWRELHSAGTDSTPKFRPVDLRFEEFVRKVEVLLHPDESGRDRSIDELSDGQSSLFHIAMTSATLDVETDILAQPESEDFLGADLPLPSLTILAFEEPENNLAPYYLSRIISQISSLVHGLRAQAVLSSHSPSILARIQPTQVRHFRLATESNTTVVRQLTLPDEENEAAKYIQQAVRAYPELYFAKVVVLGEGASEEVILPSISEAMGIPIDKSFVAMVPLGGRHVNHMWRLLTDLQIPFITLLDLDWGRHGGGWGRIKNAVAKLIEYGVDPREIFGQNLNPLGYQHNLAAFDNSPISDWNNINLWVHWLRGHKVYFSSPLDIDYSMLKAFPDQYRVAPDESSNGPSMRGEPGDAIMGDEGNPEFYANDLLNLCWYRYLFLGRGKPSTHIRVLGSIQPAQLAQNAPEELRALVQSIHSALQS